MYGAHTDNIKERHQYKERHQAAVTPYEIKNVSWRDHWFIPNKLV